MLLLGGSNFPIWPFPDSYGTPVDHQWYISVPCNISWKSYQPMLSWLDSSQICIFFLHALAYLFLCVCSRDTPWLCTEFSVLLIIFIAPRQEISVCRNIKIFFQVFIFKISLVQRHLHFAWNFMLHLFPSIDVIDHDPNLTINPNCGYSCLKKDRGLSSLKIMQQELKNAFGELGVYWKYTC